MFCNNADRERADWPLLQNGAVNLFHDPRHLDQARADLLALGYEIANVTCREGQDVFQAQVSAALRWKEQFGYEPWTGNLNALHDAMHTYPFGPSSRAALAFDGFDKIASSDAVLAHAILDIIESHARDHLLRKRLLVALVQTDDPDFECADLGGRRASWNPGEWLRSNRIG